MHKVKFNFTLNNINVYLISSIPLVLITGPSLSNIIVSIIGLIFLYFIIKKNEYKYFKHPLIIFFYVWSIYLIIRSLLSENPLLSLESSLFYWKNVIFAQAIWYTIDKNPRVLKYFFVVLSACFVILILDGLLQFFSGSNLIGYPTNYDFGHRISSFFREELILGSYLARLFPIFFGLALLFDNKKNIYIFLAVLIFIFIDLLIFLSGERTALLYVFISAGIMITLLNKWKLYGFISLFAAILIITFFTYIDKTTQLRVFDRTIDQVFEEGGLLELQVNDSSDNSINLISINFFSTQHEIIYKSAFKIFKDYPIFGIGPKLFREKCMEEKYKIVDKRDFSTTGCSTSPHNSYLQVLLELGVIGFLFIFILFLYVCIFFIKQFWYLFFYKRLFITDYQLCFLIAVFITLWPIAPGGNFFGSYINIFYFLPIGFLIHSFEKKT